MADQLDRSSIAALVPKLRRYARAATGNAAQADACTARALESVLAATARPSKTGLYRALYLALMQETPRGSSGASGGEAERLAAAVRALAPALLHALLLERLEGLAADEIAAVVGLSAAAVPELTRAAIGELRHRLSAAVLIVEDDVLVAEHLRNIVETLGHAVVDVAASAEDAITAAARRQPRLVLADVELGSAASGIDAIAAIRARAPVPVVYVTAYPERVPAARSPEPTFVVAKPFDEQRLELAMAAALQPAEPTPPVSCA
mgnify:CR=1 FL=1